MSLMNETTHMHCGECGVAFCMPTSLYQHRRNDGETFYCPNGHPRVFRPTEDQKTIADLEDKLRRRDRSIEHWAERWKECYAGREELIGVLRECPGHCGWKSNKRIPRDPVAMGRGIERVQRDVAEHLVREHGAGRAIAELPQLEAGS